VPPDRRSPWTQRCARLGAHCHRTPHRLRHKLTGSARVFEQHVEPNHIGRLGRSYPRRVTLFAVDRRDRTPLMGSRMKSVRRVDMSAVRADMTRSEIPAIMFADKLDMVNKKRPIVYRDELPGVAQTIGLRQQNHRVISSRHHLATELPTSTTVSPADGQHPTYTSRAEE
jgi:hypothetical protein